jgi:large subunit ribosomal protein L35
MPKLKTRKAAAKRVRVTRTGKLMHAKGAAGHLKYKKSYRARKAGKKMFALPGGFARKVRAMLRGG